MSDTELPYNGTEGYAGSDTSKARALEEAVNGVASKRQRYLLILAQRAGERGITVAEVRDPNLHHGRVSGALSVLHKAGRLARLTEVRGKCKVYVMPEFVNGRQTEAHGVIRKADKETIASAEVVEAWLRRNEEQSALFDIDDFEDDPLSNAIWRLVNYAQGRTE